MPCNRHYRQGAEAGSLLYLRGKTPYHFARIDHTAEFFTAYAECSEYVPVKIACAWVKHLRC